MIGLGSVQLFLDELDNMRAKYSEGQLLFVQGIGNQLLSKLCDGLLCCRKTSHLAAAAEALGVFVHYFRR